ncbi:MAG TPA: RNA methyltransferase [Anaeromyxobacteraceae bacterium]|nr:RNA methyltransferase [Anaeromyxobacteraceae bacterium]
MSRGGSRGGRAADRAAPGGSARRPAGTGTAAGSGREAGPGGFLAPERRARVDEVVAARTRTLTVVLEAFCDPQNVNAVLRTCEAFGVQEVHVVEGPMKPYDRNKKISQNADKWLEVRRWRSTAECLSHLEARGFRVYATHLGEGAVPLGALSFAEPVALVFGNESRGVSEEALRGARARFAIPMRGFVQSLNVSVAAAVSLFRAVERREAERGRHGDLSEEEARALRERFYLLAVKQRARIAKAERVLERAASRHARARR